MTITANVQQLPISEEKSKEDPFYRELKIHMQRLGHLTPFQEKLNGDQSIASYQLGDHQQLQQLKKTASKNDGMLLFYAKWSKNTVFQHLILHPNEKGFYLPFRFDTPFTIEVKNKNIWFGSSVRLLEELNWLEMTMEQKGSSDIVEYWQTFRELCHNSVDHVSPFQLENT